MLSTEMGSAQLRAQGGMETTIRGEREAGNFAEFLKSQGMDVNPRDLVGSRISMNMFADTDGSLRTGFVAVNKGTVITSQDYREHKGTLNQDDAKKLGLSRSGFYYIKSSLNGDTALFVNGESGQVFTKSNMHVERDTADGFKVVYQNPETGKAGYVQLSQGLESRDVASSVRHLRNGETATFQDDNGTLTLVSGEISSKGVMQDISGILDNGRSVSFRYNTVTGQVTDRTMSQNVNFKQDEVYRNLYDKSHGDMIKFYNLNDEATRLAFVNNLAQTLGNIIGIDETRITGGYGRLGASLGKSGGAKGPGLSGGLNISHANTQKINQITASLLHDIEESESKFGTVDYEKAEALLKNECDGLTKRGYKAGQVGLTRNASKGEAAQEHYQEKIEKFFDGAIHDGVIRKNPFEDPIL